jgi:hypothetical protein
MDLIGQHGKNHFFLPASPLSALPIETRVPADGSWSIFTDDVRKLRAPSILSERSESKELLLAFL